MKAKIEKEVREKNKEMKEEQCKEGITDHSRQEAPGMGDEKSYQREREREKEYS